MYVIIGVAGVVDGKFDVYGIWVQMWPIGFRERFRKTLRFVSIYSG